MNSKSSYEKKDTYFKKFYFKFQHKIQLVPHIQEEVKKFTDKYDQQIHRMNDQQCEVLGRAVQLKIKKIQQFYDEKYVDFRSHFILKSRKILHDFLCRHSKKLFPIKVDSQQAQSPINQNSSKVLQKKGGRSSLSSQRSSIERLSITKVQTRKKESSDTLNIKNSRSRQNKSKMSGQKKIASNPNLSRVNKTNQSYLNIQNSIEEQQCEKTYKKVELMSPTHKKINFHTPINKKMSKSQYIQYLKSKKK